MLKQCQIELVRGYLRPHLQNPPPIDVHLCNLLFQETPPLQLFINPHPFVAHVCWPTLSRIPLLTLVFIVLLFQDPSSCFWFLSSCSLKILLVVATVCHLALSRPPILASFVHLQTLSPNIAKSYHQSHFINDQTLIFNKWYTFTPLPKHSYNITCLKRQKTFSRTGCLVIGCTLNDGRSLTHLITSLCLNYSGICWVMGVYGWWACLLP
jgi:hypothetical protein